MDRILKRIFGDTFGRDKVKLLSAGTDTSTTIEISTTTENNVTSQENVKEEVKETRKIVKVSKIGSDHTFANIGKSRETCLSQPPQTTGQSA